MEKYKITPNLAISENGFLFQSNTGETFTCNLIGVKVLTGLKDGKSLDEIAEEIMDEYDVDSDRLEKDLTDFIMQLKSFNLMEEL